MDYNANSVYLRRGFKVCVDSDGDVKDENRSLVGSILKNVESMGFVFNEELINVLLTKDSDYLSSFNDLIIGDLIDMMGAGKSFDPMYPNFPNQVMRASEAELYVNAMIHYFGSWIGVRIMPSYEKDEREVLRDVGRVTVIGLGSVDDFKNMFSNIMSSKTSISQTDFDDLKWYLTEYEDAEIAPMFHKEILSFVANIVLNSEKFDINDISPSFKTATDVLRLVTAMSDGDVSLADNTRFRKMKRKERRFILSLLNKCGNITEDMLRYREKWIRIGEILHPYEYKNKFKFKNVSEAFSVLREKKKYEKFNTKVEDYFKCGEVENLACLLKTRAGDFARRLDSVLRISTNDRDSKFVLDRFAEVADKVSTPVLLQVKNHFENRNNSKIRAFIPKGIVSRVRCIDNNLKKLENHICLRVGDICDAVLQDRFSKLDPMGKVYIDPQLKNYTIPFSQRSASKTFKTVSRGSKINISEDGNTLRFFIWWKNMKGQRVDIDLSSAFFDEKWEKSNQVWYGNLRSGDIRSVHSGDITDAPGEKGACEFIDVDINSVLSSGYRYVVMNVNSYTRQNFSDIECFAGWMMRKGDPQSGDVFDARTVKNKLDLTSNGIVTIPLIVDLKDLKVIWTDIVVNNFGFVNNIITGETGILSVGKAMTMLNKPNLYDLFYLHATARAEEVVNDPKDANMVFSIDDGTTPYDLEDISSNYLI